MTVRNYEVKLFEPVLILPGFEDSSAHFSRVPGFCVLIQKPPSLQNINLVEPMFIDQSQFELIKLLINKQLLISKLFPVIYVVLPGVKDVF